MSKPNTLFPGRPDYTGPTVGWFSLLHHASELVEYSDDVTERISYIKSDKPASEQAVRLRHIVFLGDSGADYAAKRVALCADYEAKRAPLYAGYKAKRFPLDADYEAKRDALDADYEAKRPPLYAGYKAKRDALYADYKAKRDALYTDYDAKRFPLDADYEAKRDALYADYAAKRFPLDAKIIDYIKPLIDGFAWNGKELVF